MSDKAREAAHARFWELIDGDDLTDYPLAMAIDAFVAVLSETHAIVPREASEAMVHSAATTGRLDSEDSFGDDRCAREVWSAMLSAAETK